MGIRQLFDFAFAIALILLIPAYILRRSWAERGKAAPPRMVRYGRSAGLALGLTAILAGDWLASGRSAASLGFDVPPEPRGMIGLGVATLLIVGVSLVLWLKRRSGGKGPEPESLAVLPQNKRELAAFLAFSAAIGFAWELLYRGYLLWFLEPRVGVTGAVVITATAYGLAHGVKSARLLAGSLLSALVFTVAYALTRSLWWLVLIHAGLPAIAGLARFQSIRSASGQPGTTGSQAAV